MASVYLRGTNWNVKFKDAAGVWRRIPTRAQTKTEAKRLAVEIERQAERQRCGLEPLAGDGEMTLGELCQRWLGTYCPELSLRVETLRLKKHVQSKPLGEMPLRLVTTALIDDRLREMSAEGSDGARRAARNMSKRTPTRRLEIAPSAKAGSGRNRFRVRWDSTTCATPRRRYFFALASMCIVFSAS